MTQTAISPSEPYVHDGPLWLTLGAGEAANYGVGRKAAWLDRAGAAGMRVPTGVIVLDVTYKVLIRNGLLVIDHENNTVSAPEPQDVLTALGLPAFENKINVAVRSAFSAEDTPSLSMAGFFKSVLDIDVTKKPETLVDALCEVYASALEFGPDARRDVMIMQMVGAQHAGVAFTERGYQDDVVNYVTGGTADKLLLGEEEGNSAFIPRLQAFEKATYEEGPFRDKATWKDRLQIVSRRLRGIFNTENLDIEWADDGLSLYLLQVRPVTAPVRRNEAFTIANHKEILPALPSRFMVSVIESCSADLYSYYRQFDSSLPQYRPFIEVFKGRPYINLSLMTETMRALGLPTSLVTDNIGGDDAEQTSGFSIKRATAKLPNLAQLGLAQLNVAASAEATGKEIVKRTHSPGDTLGECVKTLQWTYTTLVREMFALTQAMALPLATLRRIGALEGRAAAHRTIATQIYDDLGPLRAYVAEHPELKPALAEGKLPEDAEFRRRWGLYLAKYGHRGIYESDIARPRYREAPQPLLMSLAKPVGEKRREQPPTARLDSIAGPFWNQASKAMAAREQLRHEAMRGFESIRKRLLELAEATVERGQLPNADALWDLSIDEVGLIDLDWQPEDGFFEARAEEIEKLAAYDMPDLLHRFDNLEAFNRKVDAKATTLQGISLTTGTVSGKAWVLQEPSMALPEGYTPDDTILVARSVDAGWITTFGLVAGVIVETGGDLSHGSIILREIGIPAATNVKDATRIIQDGDYVELAAGTGTVTRQK